MKAKEFLVAKVSDNGVVVVSGMRETKIKVLGSSVPISAVPNMEVTSFSFTMEKERGLIAVHVWGNNCADYFLSVTLKDGKPFVDLEEPWIPAKGKLGQLNHFGIEIAIRGKVFTTVDVKEASYLDKYARDYYVSDPNIVCSYLVGDVGAGAVMHLATQFKAEENAKLRATQLDRELHQTQRALRESTDKLTRTDEALRQSRSKAGQLEGELLAERTSRINWTDVARELSDAVEKQLFRRPSVKAVLREIDQME